MRKITAIIILSLMLLPPIWNGASFIHFLVEHTHAFCSSDVEHEHSSTDDCHTICHIALETEKGTFPNSKVEFYELKQFIPAFSDFYNTVSIADSHSANFSFSHLDGRTFIDELLRPPIA